MPEDIADGTLLKSHQAEIEGLKEIIKQDKSEIVRFQNEKIEMKASMDAKIKQVTTIPFFLTELEVPVCNRQ